MDNIAQKTQKKQQNFKFSLFENKKATKPREVTSTWSRFCEQFKKPAVRTSKDGLLFAPAIFEPPQRLSENVKELSFLAFDLDHNADFQKIKTQTESLNTAYIIHSTFSHLRKTNNNPDAEPRFRVCIPFSCPVPAKDFPVVWQFVKQKTGLPIDESAKDLSRMFYSPAIVEKDAPYVFHIQDGAAFDWQSLPLESFSTNANENANGHKTHKTQTFDFHEDRHLEFCKRVEAQAKATGRGGYEMKCPSHNGNGDTSLFYEPTKQTVACLKKPNPCSYFEVLAAFNLPSGHLPSRDKMEKEDAEFEQIKTRIKPFPVPNEKCFYGLAGEFIRLLEPHTEASKMALLFQFLVYFGNLIGRAGNYKVEGDRHFTNLFCVLVGDTAQGRKGTSFGRVKEIFKGLDEYHEKECLTSGLASGEGLIYHVRDAQFIQKKNQETGELEEILTDGGVSDKRLLVVEGEFAQVLRVQGREGNTLSSFIRNLWDTGTARSLTKNSPLKTTDAHVSIIGHITKDELLLTLSEVESANGYANRFLFCAVKRARFLPFGAEVPKVELAKLQNRLADAVNFARQKGQMNFAIKASELWIKSYEKLETSRFGFLAKITQRASPYVLRIALIFALLEESSLIEKAHLEAALSVWQYSEDSARYVFGGRLGNSEAERILTALKDNQETGLTRTQIRDLFDRHIKPEKLKTALSFLLENGLAEPKKQETNGRPTEVWLPCDISDISDKRSENEKGEYPFVAYVAYNANDGKENSEEPEEDFIPAGTEI